MDEALLKQNTDCVYFLASPLTCKKGADCEFRHSNFARLNPKDCWYWLAGNCLHPTCAFRHPPLDGHVGAPSESAPSSISANKPNVPCYFYFKGFCNKGDRCSFLHDIDGAASTGTSAMTATACNEALAHPSESKASSGNDTLSAPRMTHLNPSETASKATVDTEFQPKEVLPYHDEHPVVGDDTQESGSPQISVSGDEEAGEISVSGDEEAGEIRSGLLPAEGSIESKSHSSINESSEEQEDDRVSEEWRESSSGFDVPVDGKAEYFGCEDDSEYDTKYFLTLDGERRELNRHFLGYGFEYPDEYDPQYDPKYFLTLDGERRELNSHFLGYGLEKPDECDPAYPDVELLCERDIYSSYGCLDNRISFGNDREIPGYTQERMLDSIFDCKRKFTPMELAADEQNLLDLRDRLRRRNVTDGRSLIGIASRKHESLRLSGRVGQMAQRHATGWQMHGRLASEVGRNTYEQLRGNGTSCDGGIQLGLLQHSRQHSHSKHQKKRRLIQQQLPPWAISREKRCAQWSAGFTGTNTLSEIKQKKRKTEETRGCTRIRTYGRRTTVDFQGPKPLNEILKEKGNVAD